MLAIHIEFDEGRLVRGIERLPAFVARISGRVFCLVK